MNKDKLEQHIDNELNDFFSSARAQKCPSSMKKNLYQQIALSKPPLWQPSRLIVAGLSLALVISVVFKFNKHQYNPDLELLQAQADLEIAMHYVNQVSFKSITSVHTKGLKPGLIKPLAKSVATL